MPFSEKTGVFLPHELSLILGAPTPPVAGQEISSLQVSGWADGVFLNFTPLADIMNHKKGATREVGIILTGNNDWNVDINILQTSDDNRRLSILTQAFVKAGVGVPFYMDDASGTTIASSLVAFPRKWPTFGLNKDEVQTYTWTFYVPHLELIIGGNV